jgi:hypothetical protein
MTVGNLFAGEKIVAYICVELLGLRKCSCHLSLDLCAELSG